MSTIKDGGLFPIQLDKERYMLFSLNVIDAVEDKIGDISDLGKKMNSKGRMKFITWLLTLLINEGAAYQQYLTHGQIEGSEVIEERTVGMLIHGTNIKTVMSDIFDAFTLANRGDADLQNNEDDDEETEENDEGNAQPGGVG